MPYEIFLALRYLRVRRGRRVVKLTALAALVGISCGVAALVVAQALANGFRDELRDKILRGTAHVTVMRADGRNIREPQPLVARIEAIDGVAGAAATTYEGALLNGPAGTSYTLMRGVAREAQSAQGELRRTLTHGAVESIFQPIETQRRDSGAAPGRTPSSDDDEEEPPVPVIIGEELAARTGLTRMGDEGWIITGEKSPMPPGFAPRARRVRVTGMFSTGLYEYDSTWTYLSLSEVSAIAGEELKSSAVSIEVRDIYATAEVAARLRRALGSEWTVVDWREANRPLFAALELERRIVALIILLIMLVAALNITTTLALVVIERRADIAVLSAMGARPRSVMTIFIIEGAMLGVAGAVAGIALGLAACYAGDYFQLVRLPPDVYSISSVPLRPRVSDFLWPSLVAMAVSLLATLYPARQAARVRPAEALRYE